MPRPDDHLPAVAAVYDRRKLGGTAVAALYERRFSISAVIPALQAVIPEGRDTRCHVPRI